MAKWHLQLIRWHRTFILDNEYFRTCLEVFRTSLKTFRTSLKTFKTGLKTFRTSLKTFRTGLKTFRTGLKTFRTGLKTFRTSLKIFRTGLKTFSSGTKICLCSIGIEGATHLVHFENYKPTFRKKNPIFLENNLVHISFIKAGAEAENFYGRQKGESNWVLIGSKIKYTPFIDNRPLADPTKLEHREYKAHGLYGDKEVGLDSDILTIAYGGGTGGNTGGGIVGGNVPPVTG
ncbi:MAG: hypothetical protein ACYDEC_03670 [Bacteroidia bacterium]